MAGATGLVGRAVLDRLLDDDTWGAVHTVGRRPPARQHPKLVVHTVDTFEGLTLPAVDDVFITLGTTIKVAGSREAFRAIDFKAVLTTACAARTAGATRIGVVSAMGAHSHSAVFYNRVKGEMEEAVSRLGYPAVVIARPSLLTGDRASLQQAQRAGEGIAVKAARWLNPLLPANYRSVDAGQVASALVRAVKTAGSGHQVLLSGEIAKKA